MQAAAKIAIQLCRESNTYLVIDADGLYLIQSNPELIRGYHRAVLTPNVVEFGRLCDSLGINSKGDPTRLASQVSQALGGVTILQKSDSDRIAAREEVLVNDEQGSVRRCGGETLIFILSRLLFTPRASF